MANPNCRTPAPFPSSTRAFVEQVKKLEEAVRGYEVCPDTAISEMDLQDVSERRTDETDADTVLELQRKILDWDAVEKECRQCLAERKKSSQ